MDADINADKRSYFLCPEVEKKRGLGIRKPGPFRELLGGSEYDKHSGLNKYECCCLESISKHYRKALLEKFSPLEYLNANAACTLSIAQVTFLRTLGEWRAGLSNQKAGLVLFRGLRM